MAKLAKIRSLWSHKLPNASYADLINSMADMVLDRIDPVKKEERILHKRAKRSLDSSQPNPKANPLKESNTPSQDQNNFAGAVECNAQVFKNSRAIAAALKREVFNRDNYRCTYCDPQTGRRCESDYFLECDHLIPVALGGKTELKNLAAKCRNHNIFAAKQIFGDLMEEFVPSLRK